MPSGGWKTKSYYTQNLPLTYWYQYWNIVFIGKYNEGAGGYPGHITADGRTGWNETIYFTVAQDMSYGEASIFVIGKARS